jgi:hypothetical protein
MLLIYVQYMANMIWLADIKDSKYPFGFLFLAVTQRPPSLSSWQKGRGGEMDDLCVRTYSFFGGDERWASVMPSWEGPEVGYSPSAIPRVSHLNSGRAECSQRRVISPDNAKPVVRQGRKATGLGILDFRFSRSAI